MVKHNWLERWWFTFVLLFANLTFSCFYNKDYKKLIHYVRANLFRLKMIMLLRTSDSKWATTEFLFEMGRIVLEQLQVNPQKFPFYIVFLACPHSRNRDILDSCCDITRQKLYREKNRKIHGK